jgi:hypothetical protein
MIRALVIILAFLQFGFLEPQHSKTEATASRGPDQTVTMTFKVIPDDGIKITKDGPWKLILDRAAELGLEEKDGKFLSTKFEENVPGFKVTTKAKALPASVNYELHSFVCNDDKTQCYPEIHKGKLELKVAPQSR